MYKLSTNHGFSPSNLKYLNQSNQIIDENTSITDLDLSRLLLFTDDTYKATSHIIAYSLVTIKADVIKIIPGLRYSINRPLATGKYFDFDNQYYEILPELRYSETEDGTLVQDNNGDQIRLVIDGIVQYYDLDPELRYDYNTDYVADNNGDYILFDGNYYKINNYQRFTTQDCTTESPTGQYIRLLTSLTGYINFDSEINIDNGQIVTINLEEINNSYYFTPEVKNLSNEYYDTSKQEINTTIFSNNLAPTCRQISNNMNSIISGKNDHIISTDESANLIYYKSDYEFIFKINTDSQRWCSNLKYYLNLSELLRLKEFNLSTQDIITRYTYLGSSVFDGVNIYSIVPITYEGNNITKFYIIYSGGNNFKKVLVYNVELTIKASDLSNIQRPIIIPFFNSLYANFNNKLYFIKPIDNSNIINYIFHNTEVELIDIPGITKFSDFSDFTYLAYNYYSGKLRLIDYTGGIHNFDDFKTDDAYIKSLIPSEMYDIYHDTDEWTNISLNIKVAGLNIKRHIINNKYKFEDIYIYDNFLLRAVGNGNNYLYPYSPYMKYKKINLTSKTRVYASNNYIFSEDDTSYQINYFSKDEVLVTNKSIGNRFFSFRGLLLNINDQSVEVLNGKLIN